MLELVGGGLRDGEEHGDALRVAHYREEDAVDLAGERAHVRGLAGAKVEVLQPQARPRRDDQARRQVRPGAAPLLQEVHHGAHVVVVHALLGVLHQPHSVARGRGRGRGSGHQLRRRGLGAPEHEAVAVVAPGQLGLQAPPHVHGEEQLHAERARRVQGAHPRAPHVRGQRLEGGALERRRALPLEPEQVRRREGERHGRQRLPQQARQQARRRLVRVPVAVAVADYGAADAAAAAVLRVRERDARRAARAQCAAVVERQGNVVVVVGAGARCILAAAHGARPGVEELRGADAVAEAVVDGGAEDHAAAAEPSDLGSASERATSCRHQHLICFAFSESPRIDYS